MQKIKLNHIFNQHLNLKLAGGWGYFYSTPQAKDKLEKVSVADKTWTRAVNTADRDRWLHLHASGNLPINNIR